MVTLEASVLALLRGTLLFFSESLVRPSRRLSPSHRALLRAFGFGGLRRVEQGAQIRGGSMELFVRSL